MIGDLLQRKCDVINRGFSGYNTKHLRIILHELLEEFEPEDVCGFVLMLGSNDSTDPTNKIQHVSLEDYKKNMRWIIDYILNKWGLPKDKLILISPPKINDQKWEMANNCGNCIVTHFDNLVFKYAQESVKIAKELEIPYVDLYSLMEQEINVYAEYLFDGLHLSNSGAEFLMRNLKPLIENNVYKDLKSNYPYWRDLDENAQNSGIKRFRV